MPVHATARGGDANRAADVAPDLEGSEPRGKCRAAAARAAARRASEIPRVIGASVYRAVGLPIGEGLGDIGLAEETRPRREHAGGERPVVRGPMVLERRQAGRLWQAGRLRRFLQRDRQSQERAPLALGEGRIGVPRRLPRVIRRAHGDGVERTITLFDPGEEEVRELERRDLLCPQRREHVCCRAVGPDRLCHHDLRGEHRDISDKAPRFPGGARFDETHPATRCNLTSHRQERPTLGGKAYSLVSDPIRRAPGAEDPRDGGVYKAWVSGCMVRDLDGPKRIGHSGDSGVPGLAPALVSAWAQAATSPMSWILRPIWPWSTRCNSVKLSGPSHRNAPWCS